MLLRTVLAAALLCSFSVSAADDPILGTWSLNLAKSKFNPGPPPTSETRTYADSPEGIQVTIRRVDEKGKSSTVEFPERYGGSYYPIKGSAIADTLSLVRVNDYTAETKMKHGDSVVATARREITDEGKTLRISFKVMDSEHPVDNELVYDKR